MRLFVVWRTTANLKIGYGGVRTWRTTPRGFEINDVSEPPNPLGVLMPRPVRKMFAAP